MKFDDRPLAAGLYLVATPIGSARDITLRALDVLAAADVIAAEDTRTARKLMDIHGVPLAGRPVVAYHDHSGTAAVAKLVDRVGNGQSVAYVSEAGMPLVADPGYELVVAMRAAGHLVTAAPGASAALTAVSLAGLPTDKFAFLGFLPATRTARQADIAAHRDLAFTLIIFESPKRVYELLCDLSEVLGSERRASVCRELTKRFEEVQTATLGELVERFKGATVKGEIVVLVDRPGEAEVDDETIKAALRDALPRMRMKDAATAVAGALGLPRRQVYQIALAMKDET